MSSGGITRIAMTLASQAQELVRTMQSVVTSLARYGLDYTGTLADRLRPLVAELQSAIITRRSRPDAERVLADMSELMHEVNGAATKGEMAIFPDDTLDRYWHLSTIFRESRFAGQTL